LLHAVPISGAVMFDMSGLICNIKCCLTPVALWGYGCYTCAAESAGGGHERGAGQRARNLMHAIMKAVPGGGR
jgi:hypothetical protein